MRVNKCDLCQKEIKTPIVASIGLLCSTGLEMCEDCGAPILRFLRKHKVIDKNNKEIKQS